MRNDARRYIARWKEDTIQLTVPPGADAGSITRALDSLAPRLLARKPAVAYHDGDVIALDGITFRISRQKLKPGHVMASFRDDNGYIEVGEHLEITSGETTALISRMMCRIAEKAAPALLIPRARALAAQLGLSPASWRIMKGFRTLGRCTSSREIYLSYVNVFLPAGLRDYIVWHELAHLSEMSHSPRFHAICDSYCSGREKALAKALHDYRWPVFRR